MKLLLEDALEIANGIWLTFAPPHQLTKVGLPKTAHGKRSILLACSPSFDSKNRHLLLDADSIAVLNLGTSPSTLVVDTIVDAKLAQASEDELLDVGELGPGDREFQKLAETDLRGEAQEAAVDLIRAVRRRWPGDLKRGERNNFSNTPDNFWYVIVQPRVQAMSVTVRGAPERFHSDSLTLKVDRPGYTRFTIKAPDEVSEALRIIEQSKRK